MLLSYSKKVFNTHAVAFLLVACQLRLQPSLAFYRYLIAAVGDIAFTLASVSG